jgi:hypothetical protein
VTARPLPGVRSRMWPTATGRARRQGVLGDAVVPHQTALFVRLQEASW